MHEQEAQETALEFIISHFAGVRYSGSGLMAHCPAHEDRTRSLSINLADDGDTVLIKCHAGCTFEEVLRAADLPAKYLFLSTVAEELELPNPHARSALKAFKPALGPDAAPARRSVSKAGPTPARTKGLGKVDPEAYYYYPRAPLPQPAGPAATAAARREVAHYDYVGADGAVLFRKVRYEPKSFTIKHPAGDGTFAYGMGGATPVLYRLPDVLEAIAEGRPVFVVEGEKDADRLASLTDLHGRPICATTNFEGADANGAKWRGAYTETLKGASEVYVVPDNDKAGRGHAEHVAASLHAAGVRTYLVSLPVQEGEDLSDLLDRGWTAHQLFAVCSLLAPYGSETEPAAPAGAAGGADESGEPPDAEGAPSSGNADASAATPIVPLAGGVEAEAGPAPPAAPSGGLAFRPFPLRAFPRTIYDYVCEAARAIPCDAAFIAAHVLGVLAGLIGGRYKTSPKGSWVEALALWIVTVAESGSAKSPAFDAAVDEVRRLDAELEKENARVMAQHRQEVAEAQANGLDPNSVEAPTTRRLVMDDVTVERAIELVALHQCGLLLRDELAGWIGSFNAYKRGASDTQAWIEFRNGKPRRVDRKGYGDGGLLVPNPAVSVTGTIQPDVLGRLLTEELDDTGFSARLMMAMPPSNPKVFTDDEVDPATAAAYAQTLNNLAFMGVDHEAPVVLTMTPPARALFKAYVNDKAVEAWGLPEGPQRKFLAKCEGFLARISAVLTLAERAEHGHEPREIEAAAVESAIEIVNWFTHEHARVQARIRGASPRAVPVEDLLDQALPAEFTTSEYYLLARQLCGLQERAARDRLKKACREGLYYEVKKGHYAKAGHGPAAARQKAEPADPAAPADPAGEAAP